MKKVTGRKGASETGAVVFATGRRRATNSGPPSTNSKSATAEPIHVAGQKFQAPARIAASHVDSQHRSPTAPRDSEMAVEGTWERLSSSEKDPRSYLRKTEAARAQLVVKRARV